MENVENIAKRKGRSIFFKQRVMGYLFLAPTAVFFIVFAVIPLVMSFYLAFADYNLVVVRNMVGFKHFANAFQNKDFMRSFLNILIYAVMNVPFSIITSLLVAVLVNTKTRGIKIFRIIYYIPAVTGGVAIAYVWKWMFNPDFGLFNGILAVFHIPPLKWIESDSYLVMVCVVMVTVWSGIGGNMLVFLAALKGISPEYYEAARVDGANAFQRLIRITVPSIAPTMYFVTTMSIIGAFQMFDLVYIMIPPGAMKWARTPVVMIHELGFTRYNGGYGTAMSLILFAVIMVATFIFQAIAKEDKTV